MAGLWKSGRYYEKMDEDALGRYYYQGRIIGPFSFQKYANGDICKAYVVYIFT